MADSRTPHPRSYRTSRGTVYFAVLSTAMLISVIGLGALSLARSQSRSLVVASHAADARWSAQSGIEVALGMMDRNSLWRSAYPSGTWLANVPLGRGTFDVSVTNPLGALNRSATDSVVVTGRGHVGEATHEVSVEVSAQQLVPTSLSCAASVGGTISFTNATVSATSSIIAGNSTVTALASTISADVEASTAITGVTYSGKTTAGVAQRRMPPSTVWQYYTNRGTTIPISSIPLNLLTREIRDVTLSPTTNPFGGGLNNDGIYIIDAGGQSLRISKSRINATLIIRDAAGSVDILSQVSWSAPLPNHPCLMVDGNANIAIDNGILSIASELPLVGGVIGGLAGSGSGSSTASYVSSIDGLVYVSRNLTISNTLSTRNLIVGGNLSVTGTLALSYDPSYASDPPPGFTWIRMRPRLGTWTQQVD